MSSSRYSHCAVGLGNGSIIVTGGYGGFGSAERLDIAVETVRRHRKSIYRKLDVSSQTDLFSLFINAMSCLGEAAGEDPLKVYMSPR